MISDVERVASPQRAPLINERSQTGRAQVPPAVRRLIRGARWITTPSVAALLVFAGGLGFAVMWVMRDAIVDDGYITLDYARTLAFNHQWGLVPGVPANTATSPLNVMILAALTSVLRDPMTALWAVAIVNPIVMAAGLRQLGQQWRVGARLAWIATPMLVLNPLLASSIGLETTLTVTVIVWLLERAAAGDPRGFGWLSGVAIVLRPDMIIVVALIWLGHPELRHARGTRLRQQVRATAAVGWRAVVIGLPWYAFSWVYFGSAIPDTLAIKQGQAWGSFWNGLTTRLHHLYPAAVDATLVFAIVGVLALLATPFLRRVYPQVARRVAVTGIVGIAYYGAYVALDVPPYFWYYGIPIASLTIVGAWGIAAYSHWYADAPGRLVSRIVCAVLALAVLSPAMVSWGTSLDAKSPLRHAPIVENWALSGQYKHIGIVIARELPAGTAVRSPGEFGALLYYCDCNLVDRFDNRALIMSHLLEAKHSSFLMRLNYFFLDPSDYPPVREDVHLQWEPGPATGPGEWNTWSPTHHQGHLVLLAGPRPRDVREGGVE